MIHSFPKSFLNVCIFRIYSKSVSFSGNSLQGIPYWGKYSGILYLETYSLSVFTKNSGFCQFSEITRKILKHFFRYLDWAKLSITRNFKLQKKKIEDKSIGEISVKNPWNVFNFKIEGGSFRSEFLDSPEYCSFFRNFCILTENLSNPKNRVSRETLKFFFEVYNPLESQNFSGRKFFGKK